MVGSGFSGRTLALGTRRVMAAFDNDVVGAIGTLSRKQTSTLALAQQLTPDITVEPLITEAAKHLQRPRAPVLKHRYWETEPSLYTLDYATDRLLSNWQDWLFGREMGYI